MENFNQKRSRIFHFLALGAVAGSVFLQDPTQKIGLLLLGIGVLAFIAFSKKQHLLFTVYIVLFLAAVAFYFFYLRRDLALPFTV